MKKLILSLATVTLFFSCSDDDDVNPVVEIPEETITNVDVQLVSYSGEMVTLSFVDADGISLGNPGSVVGGDSVLEANTEYIGSFAITNALADDEEEMNVTAEILE